MRKLGPTQQKLLLLLLGTATLCLTGAQPYRVLRALRKDWRKIEQNNFNRSLQTLRKEKLLAISRSTDGTVRLKLTSAGKKRARLLQFFHTTIKRPKKWDAYWRIVMFDIPEEDKFFRNVFRKHLLNIGFRKMQKSAFIFPFPCEKELLKIIDLYQAHSFVRIITAIAIDNEKEWRKVFALPSRS